ncbi:MAG TPA: hypothetical protein VL282_03745 [Tepidisphaeraceae bacterium]|jgi:hypothetical protein|nr:hypothetical protein [Tepidisphaeraceae bacterium]
MRAFLVLILPLLAAPAARAASLQLSLPAQGYYRSGQYMPVLIRGGEGELTLRADGAVPTRIHRDKNAPDVIVPLLMMRSEAREVMGSIGDASVRTGPLHALDPRERIVGTTGADAAIAADLFPGERIISIPIDRQFPAPAPYPAAWDLLDAVVLEQSPQSLLKNIDVLAEMGVSIAVHADQPPDKIWPWKTVGTYQVYRPIIHAPDFPMVDESYYVSTSGWNPGEELPVRQLVVLTAVLISVLAIGAALLPRRWNVIAIGAISALGVAAANIFFPTPEPPSMRGDITIVNPDRTRQIDSWSYHRTWQQSNPFRVGFGDLCYPAPASDTQVEQSKIVLRCKETGGPQGFDLELPARHTIAMMHRFVSEPMDPPAVEPEIEHISVTGLAREKYVSPSLHIVGRDIKSGAVVLKAK